jgi:DNA-binding response OmpR family regulator
VGVALVGGLPARRRTVRTASDGESALEALDDDVDVTLLDRRMPGLAGGEVLEAIRRRGIDCRVAMVTAVEPDFDIIDMEFDDYLVKPVSKQEVRGVIETLLTRRTFDERLRECFAIVSKKAALEASMDRDELESAAEYRELEERLADAEAAADESLDELIHRGAIVGAYDDVQSQS